MFQPNLGRWLTMDPIGIAAGDPNFYRFVGNSPINFTDPSGLAPTPEDFRKLWYDIFIQQGHSERIARAMAEGAVEEFERYGMINQGAYDRLKVKLKSGAPTVRVPAPNSPTVRVPKPTPTPSKLENFLTKNGKTIGGGTLLGGMIGLCEADEGKACGVPGDAKLIREEPGLQETKRYYQGRDGTIYVCISGGPRHGQLIDTVPPTPKGKIAIQRPDGTIRYIDGDLPESEKPPKR
jgi:hypothetical protein